MVREVVECVPNFSEGRDKAVIEAIADAVRKTPGCTVLDVDPGVSTNRTVYTFVGNKKTVIEGALNACRVAYKLIDMTKHHGEHPRMGACDVCPFIPISGVTMEDCVEVSREFARRAAEELHIPIYMYEFAETKGAYRHTLPQIRAGEYEKLSERIVMKEWEPDFGPAEFVPRWGATVCGARKLLIAFNINVLGTKQQAHRIALNVRTAGRGPKEPGRLQELKAIGWYVEDYGIAQISCNLTDYNVTNMHQVFEECEKDARELNISLCGGEIVGLVNLDSILKVADYYIQKENLFILEERQKIMLVVQRLGLNSVKPFDPKKTIIEYMVEEKPDEPLASLSVREFVEVLGSRTAAPGGGSASSLVSSMGIGLGAMVGWMTYGIRKFESVDMQMRVLIKNLDALMREMIPMIDRDTNAFNAYMEAMKMPKKTPEEIEARDAAMLEGLKTAIQVPLQGMRTASKAWEFMIGMARIGNIKSMSDLQVGAKCLETGIWGCYQNVLINLGDIADEAFKTEVLAEAETIVSKSKEALEQVLEILKARKEEEASAKQA